MRRRRGVHRLQQQWLVLAFGLGSSEHRQLVPVRELSHLAHHHLHVALLAELAEHMLIEGRLLHPRRLEGALVARAWPSAVPAHVHVAVGGGRVRARYLGAHLARLRRGA